MKNIEKSIILMGIKHCGKSTQGKLLASSLNLPFFDTDDLIFEQTKKTPREIYNEFGKEKFIESELLACEYLMQKTNGERFVLATGGGICENKCALELLHKNGIFIFLSGSEELSSARIMSEITIASNGELQNVPSFIAKNNPRTIEDARAVFHNFYVERYKIYSEIADFCVNMENVSKEENASHILNLVSASTAATAARI